ncbi:hypothetical protein Cob_v008493 [Colletotrichum orbiculare MAFF 240422]|uniref:Uncharacterized protein n=1 Tax=Colletotrichum orbiculare (strain 104-T / ATCC 96160 / CBS 514.97 / LARS 414 / MAFF 240422) TaxID=1213857 RepID=N4VCD0_COLOR|nr:hypothetical protein Cob_v008493 [Colletotrichum orbiculare MAFF 240422]
METMSSSSELSDIASPESDTTSSASFQTAFQSPHGIAAMHPLAASSYATARELPRVLKNHCQIYLEEHLYSGALGLLNSLLTAGFSRQTVTAKPVHVPPSTHLALLNTLLIHPSHTTRAAGSDRLEIGSQVLDYLRNLLAIAGPISAPFKDAFQFHGSRYARGIRQIEDDDDIDGDQINNKLTGDDAIWNRAQDFWAVVGWAFNCSRLHPHRWRYWKIWLEYMLDVLEADLEVRKRNDGESSPRSNVPKWTDVRESIVVMYIRQTAGSSRHASKTILHSIFADGDAPSLAKFPEIFNKETKGLPSEDKKRKRLATLDIDKDQFGDYFDDDFVDSGPSDGEYPGTPGTPRTPSRKAGDIVTIETAESIPLRIRLMGLLADVAICLPTEFKEHHDYTSEVCGLLKQQPLTFFQHFVSDMGAHLNGHFERDMLATLLDTLLPSDYVDPREVVPDSSSLVVNADVLAKCYLPHHANNVDPEDNARLALILENLIQKLSVEDIRVSRLELVTAAEKGIEARQARAKVRRAYRKSKKSQQKALYTRDDHAKEMMNLAGERILLYIDAMGAEPEDDPDREMTD